MLIESMGSYSKQDCIQAISTANDRLGESPSKRQYRELDIKPSYSTIVREVGGWNKAKKEANVPVIKRKTSNHIQDKPEDVEIPEDLDWKEDLNARQRWYYKNKEKEIEYARKYKGEMKEWFEEFKKQFECENCGEDRHYCLDFHHESKKNFGIGKALHTYGKETIKREVKENCRVLCANCHRELHYG